MPIELAPKIYWVGVNDWTIRDFHGYLTEDGSTYNAYLIMDEHITLIDTVKKEFVPEMLARVAEIVDPAKIDYIVSNHVEMDHSGGLPEVIQRVQPEKLFCSPMGKAGLSRHYQNGVALGRSQDRQRAGHGEISPGLPGNPHAPLAGFHDDLPQRGADLLLQ